MTILFHSNTFHILLVSTSLYKLLFLKNVAFVQSFSIPPTITTNYKTSLPFSSIYHPSNRNRNQNHHPHTSLFYPATSSTTTTQRRVAILEHTDFLLSSLSLPPTPALLTLTRETAETIAGPFFGASLFPYLAFLYFLDVPENNTPKGVTVGFATCLVFVFLTIPAAILAQVLYGVSLADSDWLHGSAESLLTVTNLVTVVAFRQALNAKQRPQASGGEALRMPDSAESYRPMVVLVVVLTALASITAFWPALTGASVHTPYLNGFMDVPKEFVTWGGEDPENSLSVACWIIHISSLVEFLVAMGFAWRWADISNNPKWKGLTWGLLPLHSSGITACVYHLFYNSMPVLVPFQAFLTCFGNTTAAYAAYRIAISNGWTIDSSSLPASVKGFFQNQDENALETTTSMMQTTILPSKEEAPSFLGFEDLGDALSNDNDYTFLFKLFFGCAIASYTVKYGALFFDVLLAGDSSVFLALLFIAIPSVLNAFKWYKRSYDPSFEGWF